MTPHISSATLVFLSLALLACEVLGAQVPDSLRAAARGGSVEIFVLLHPGGDDRGYTTPTESAFAARTRTSFLRGLASGRIKVVREYRGLAAFTLDVDAAALEAVAAHPDVRAMEPMRHGGAALATSVAQIGADRLHAGQLRGAGAVLALLDSGIDAGHPDVAGRVEAEECICARCCKSGSSRDSGAGSAASLSAHGPHVAGILASAGVVGPAGVAPDARLVGVRVLNDANRGSLADWVAALDYILSERPEVQVVNMSLVSDMRYAAPCDDADGFTMAMSELVRRLRLRGTLVVAAAGNSRSVGELPAPACLRDVVSVGAVNRDDAIASFSNVAGPLSLLAPGVGIVSGAPGGKTTTASGTSMAAPHVAGGLALLVPFVGRPFIAALPGVMRANGPRISDDRLCDDGRCERFSRLDVDSAANWLSSIRTMQSGGGSPSRDCQVEWRINGMQGESGLRATRTRCRDGDPACDSDDIEGQCSFRVQACFNVPDLRLVTCDPLQSVTAYHLLRPSLRSRNEADLQNAIRVLTSLPALPIEESGQCGTPFDFVVPAGMSRVLRLIVETPRGRDSDRFRFGCRR